MHLLSKGDEGKIDGHLILSSEVFLVSFRIFKADEQVSFYRHVYCGLNEHSKQIESTRQRI